MEKPVENVDNSDLHNPGFVDNFRFMSTDVPSRKNPAGNDCHPFRHSEARSAVGIRSSLTLQESRIATRLTALAMTLGFFRHSQERSAVGIRSHNRKLRFAATDLSTICPMTETASNKINPILEKQRIYL